MTEKTKNISSKKEEIISRTGLIYIFFLIIASLIVIQIINLQLFQRDKWIEKYEKNAVQRRNIQPARSDIYDVNGKLLATSMPYFNIFFDTRAGGLDKKTFYSNIDSLSLCLSKLLGDKTKEEYKRELIKARETKKGKQQGDRYKFIARKLDYMKYKKIKNFPIFRRGKHKGGFIKEETTERTLPFNYLIARTIGYLKVDSILNEKIGEVGLEHFYDETLKGISGKKRMQKLPGGVWMPFEESEDVEPIEGEDIILSIDINIQDYAHRVLENHLRETGAEHGTVILMETETGFIKSIVNLGVKKDSSYAEIDNYGVGERLDPGSTFKLASLMVALEDDYINLNDVISTGNGKIKYSDFTISDTKEGGYGNITVQQVFEHSSNVGVSKIINKYYKKNPQKFIDRLFDIGILSKSGIDLSNENTPFIKHPGSGDWSGITLEQTSIGYEVQLTPLQMLTFYNAVANNGQMVKARLVKAFSKNGKITRTTEKGIIKEAICSKETLRKAKIMLEGVVERGTAKRIKSDNYKIAGKTGTAKYFSNERKVFIDKYRASFVGYFPANNPKYSCIVVIDKPNKGQYYGGEIAAPVFRKIADKIYSIDLNTHNLNNYKINKKIIEIPYSKNGYKKDVDLVFSQLKIPVGNKGKSSTAWVNTSSHKHSIEYSNRKINKYSVPSVIGMGAKDAVFLLESLGMKVMLKGKGVVKKQSVEVGARISVGKKITIELN